MKKLSLILLSGLFVVFGASNLKAIAASDVILVTMEVVTENTVNILGTPPVLLLTSPGGIGPDVSASSTGITWSYATGPSNGKVVRGKISADILTPNISLEANAIAGGTGTSAGFVALSSVNAPLVSAIDGNTSASSLGLTFRFNALSAQTGAVAQFSTTFTMTLADV